MKGYIRCEKGHFYKDTLTECNFCPKKKGADVIDETAVVGKENNDTINIPTEKTQVFGGGAQSNPKSTSSGESFDPNKTIISGGGTDDGDSKDQKTQRRKLGGWLVSFDIEDFGVDFKVNEGRNRIGSNASNEITIQDNQVSALHGLILYKKKKFILTDELSTNGTLLNGKELVPRNTYELNDGDEIKIGDTALLFKTAFKE